jgi:integrase
MCCVFRKTKTWAIPASAKITKSKGKTIATWLRRRGKSESAEVVTLEDGRRVIRVESGNYFAKYRNVDDKVVTVSTGCRDRSMAEQVLKRLERDVERVHSGVVSREEFCRAERSVGAIEGHIWDYCDTLIRTEGHVKDTRRYLNVLAKACGWKTLADMRLEDLEAWLAEQARPKADGSRGMSARTRKAHQTAIIAFARWNLKAKRLSVNLFAAMSKANEEADPRRPRRALTEDEFGRPLEAARNAPARPAGKAGSQSSRPAQRLSGPERADLYVVLVLTGLRINELADVRVADVRLDGRVPGIELPAAVDKRRREGFIPLRADLVALIRSRIEGLGLSPTDRIFRRSRRPDQAVKRRLQACGHTEKRRPGPDRGHPRAPDDLQHLAGQGRGPSEDCAGADEAFGHRADDQGLHGPGIVRSRYSRRVPPYGAPYGAPDWRHFPARDVNGCQQWGSVGRGQSRVLTPCGA